MHSIAFLHRSKALSDLLRTRIFARTMGGGPRTFPGGINKWQWKRLHEKKAKEKEKRLLEQEKQIYQARIRSQIRAKLSGQPDPDSGQVPGSTTHGPMTPQTQIKALADRFMKEGAEDLWNEDDGPLKSDERPRSVEGSEGQRSFGVSSRKGSIGSPIDLRKLISDNRTVSSNSENLNSMNVNNSNYVSARKYSMQVRSKFHRNESSSSEEESKFNSKDDLVKQFGGRLDGDRVESVNNSIKRNQRVKDGGFLVSKLGKFRKHGSCLSGGGSRFSTVKPFASNLEGKRQNGNGQVKRRKFPSHRERRLSRNGSSSTDDDSDFDSEDENEVGNGRNVKRLGSSAALGKYDMKITKRIPLTKIEEVCNFSEEVQFIRNELSKKSQNDEEKIEKESFFCGKRFDECGISPLSVKALSASGYVQMTRVQEATLSVCLEGKDVLVKAKTGTGKSAAFLLPAIEAVLKATGSSTVQRVPPIYVLILCPTRELASQIAAEANAMVRYHSGIGVQTLVGGTRFKVDQKRLESDPCQIIVATPGRLLDHIENKSGLSVRLMGLKMLIVDEADQLLDLGFRKDLEKIVDCLPRQRQSLLFSATIPKEVRRVSQLVLKREHTFVDTVGLGCVETHDKVKQSFLVAPHELHFQIVHHLLKEHILHAPDYKVILFYSTGMVTSLMYQLLRDMKFSVREIHSRKPQLYRSRISDEFKESKRVILVTSDVSARGMNYPDVTLVIQVGVPSDREQYIHRLGRTGREGKEGEGILLLAPWEKYFLDDLKDLPLQNLPSPQIDSDAKLMIENTITKIDSSVKEAAYHAWLGYYNSIREIGRDKTTLVELANKFCESIGLQKPPSLFRKTALKMGLKDIPGIRIRK